MVARGEPFQFTTESLVNVVPFEAVTVSMNPLALPQKGAEFGDSEAIDAGDPGVAPILKRTTLDISVVVVLETFCVADWAEPGICTAIWTVPAVVRSDAGTGAVS